MRGKKAEVNLKVAVLENLTIRREATATGGVTQAATQTHMLVEHGQIIDKKAPVVKTHVTVTTPGEVSLGSAKGDKDAPFAMLASIQEYDNFLGRVLTPPQEIHVGVTTVVLLPLLRLQPAC